jgi:hypothetical protein
MQRRIGNSSGPAMVRSTSVSELTNAVSMVTADRTQGDGRLHRQKLHRVVDEPQPAAGQVREIAGSELNRSLPSKHSRGHDSHIRVHRGDGG